MAYAVHERRPRRVSPLRRAAERAAKATASIDETPAAGPTFFD
jgi:hypothetical protein